MSIALRCEHNLWTHACGHATRLMSCSPLKTMENCSLIPTMCLCTIPMLIHSPFTGVQNEVQSIGTGSSCTYVAQSEVLCTLCFLEILLHLATLKMSEHISDNSSQQNATLEGSTAICVHTCAFIKHICGQQCWLLWSYVQVNHYRHRPWIITPMNRALK